MRLTTILDELGRPFSYYPGVVDLVDDLETGILLCYLTWFTPDEQEANDGWFYSKTERIQRATGLSLNQQRRARSRLAEMGLVETALRDTPPKLYYRVDLDRLNDLWEQRHDRIEARRAKFAEQTTNGRRRALLQKAAQALEAEAVPVEPVAPAEAIPSPAPAPKKPRARKEKPAAEPPLQKRLIGVFEMAFTANHPHHLKYPFQKKDGVQIARLIRGNQDAPGFEDLFARATRHYFESDITHRTLADLCARFDAFSVSPLNQFKQRKESSNGNGHGSGQQSSVYSAEVI